MPNTFDPIDLEDDLSQRWLPSPEQRADAKANLQALSIEYVYTVQILHGKYFGFWNADVIVECPRAIFYDRNSASEFAQALVAQVRAKGGVATASYARHFLQNGREEAAVFEDILTSGRV